jgi:hypothetical protein
VKIWPLWVTMSPRATPAAASRMSGKRIMGLRMKMQPLISSYRLSILLGQNVRRMDLDISTYEESEDSTEEAGRNANIITLEN